MSKRGAKSQDIYLFCQLYCIRPLILRTISANMTDTNIIFTSSHREAPKINNEQKQMIFKEETHA